MKARTKFLKFFSDLPILARKKLVFGWWTSNPMSLSVVALEVKMNTKLSKQVLAELGFKDE